jgi:3-hydroxy-9,10-secoandrosta-1,3,5(10)-triene-9,17-dione monooxygenase
MEMSQSAPVGEASQSGPGGEPLTSDDLIARAAAVVRETDRSENVVAADRDRRLPDETVEALISSTLIRALRPRRLGGHEVDPMTYLEISRTLAGGLPALAWVFQVTSAHEWYLAYANPTLQGEIWDRDADALVVDSVAPMGHAEVVEDGFRVTGRWRFLSGIEWAGWIAVNAMTELPDGQGPEPCLYFLPKTDVEVVDDWHTIAMRGSASRGVIVDNAFVPAHRMMHFARIAATGRPQGPVTDAGPLYRVPFAPMIAMSIFPAVLGIAERALREFKTWTEQRVRPMGGARQKDAPAALFALAEATVRWESAYQIARRYAEELWQAGLDDKPAEDPDRRAHFFAWRAYIGRTCAQVIETVFLESGANALFESHPLSMLWREGHAAAQHATMDYGDGMTSFGRTLVGLPGHPMM